jgi:hypothetical protein
MSINEYHTMRAQREPGRQQGSVLSVQAPLGSQLMSCWGGLVLELVSPLQTGQLFLYPNAEARPVHYQAPGAHACNLSHPGGRD